MNGIKLFKNSRLPYCSIIALNYNAKDYLVRCLNSLKKINYPKNRYQIVLVDNASTDGSLELARRKVKGISIIKNKKNVGFSRGNNVALRSLKADYYVLLNPDTYVDKNWLINMVKVSESDKSIGLCSSKILSDDGHKINYAGGLVNFMGFAWPRGFNQAGAKRFGGIEETAFASGASLLIRKSVLEDIGLLDEDYFMYHEDIDYSWRARLFGYKVLYVPNSVAYHKYEGSVRGEMGRVRKFYHLEKNRVETLIKNYSLKSLLLLSPAFLITEVGLTLYFLAVYRSSLKLVAFFNIVKNLGSILKKRQFIQGRRVVDDKQIMKHFTYKVPTHFLPEGAVRLIEPVMKAYYKFIISLS